MLKKEAKELISFIESSKGFDNNAKLKLILFSAGVKPNTYVSLRISTKNLDEKYHFEQQHDKADLIAGKLYGYPRCCINRFIEEHDLKKLAKKYSYYAFYDKLHTLDKRFPFLSHTPCSLKCKDSIKINNDYRMIVKKSASRFWKEYTRKQSFTTKLVVDYESGIFLDKINENKSIWPKKDGHDYGLISLTKFKGHHYVFSNLSKKHYLRGTILLAKVTVQYDYAIIKIKKIVRLLNNFHHQRKLLGKK